MILFDFHHHHPGKNGIYNLELGSIPSQHLYSVGIHPQDIEPENTDEQLSWLRSNIGENCFAIGECGLDRFVNISDQIQAEVFRKQIEIANEFRKPVIIHCVRKFYEVISFRKYAKQPMIIHGFNKKQSIANDLLKNNFYLSFGKAVLYNLSLQNVVTTVPLDKIFLETDNEDLNIEALYLKVSALKSLSVEQLHEQILENLDTIKNR